MIDEKRLIERVDEEIRAQYKKAKKLTGWEKTYKLGVLIGLLKLRDLIDEMEDAE